jgi:hypothetical protein
VPRRDVDATRRFVEDEDLGPGREPLGQDDLLLVAAAEMQHLLFGSGGANPQARNRVLRLPSLPRAADDAEA